MNRSLLVFFLFSVFSAGVFAQPSNDDCVNATPIIIPMSGSVCVNATLTGATDDGVFTNNCEQSGSQEVWFTFVAAGPNNSVTVRPIGATPASNLAVSLKPDSCNGNVISSCNAAVGAGTATLNWVYQTGTRVYVYVSSNTNSGGTFEICVSSIQQPAVGGKDCSTAEPLCNMNNFTSTIGPGSNGFQPPCFGSPLQRPIIYQFTVGQGGLLNWRATPTCTTNPNTTEFDWAVYDVTGGCPGTLVKCNYNFTGGFFSPPVTSPQGMQGPTTANNQGCVSNQGTTAAEICSGANVVAGRTYAIYLDQYTSGSNCSVAFSFAGSTFTMAPTALFNASVTSGCAPLTVNFTNNSVSASSYLWDFDDGTIFNGANPPSKTFTTPGTYLVSLKVVSASGCEDVEARAITVFPQPTVSVNNDTICAGSGIQATLTATPTVPGGTYSWSPGGQTSQSITVNPATTTNYTVTYTANGCVATGQGRVVVNNVNFTVDARKDTVICGNQSTTITAVPSVPGSYTYRWTPAGAGMNDSTLQTPTVSPAQTTRYTVVVRNAQGCSATDTVLVGVVGQGPSVKASANPILLCPGQPTTLSFILEPKFCGVNNSLLGTGSTNVSGDVGNGTAIPNPTQPFASPTVYGNYLRSTRNQYLYRASELAAALGTGGRITSVGFNVGQFNSNASLESFTIRMACTNDTAINAFVNTGLQTVVGPISYVPINNPWNNHQLTNWFDWDGQSNLIIDVCWNNPNTSGSANNKARVTTTTFNSCVYASANTNQCGITGGTAVNQRPNTRFQKSTQGYDSLSWTPNVGLNAVSNRTAVSPTASPFTTQTYTINVYNKGCVGSDVVTVQVDTSLRVNAGNDTTICPGGSAQINTVVTGNLGPVTYVWAPPATLNNSTIANPRATPSGTTSYIVVASSGGCQARDTITVTVAAPTVSVTGTNVSCNGGATGSATATPSGGTPPYTYLWTGGATTPTITNRPVGQYSVTVTDSKGCTVTGSYTITQPPALTVAQQTIRNVSCNGGSNGFISVLVNGGTPGYSFTWSPNAPNNDTIQNLVAGSYQLTVTDNNNCTATGNYNITQPTPLVFGAANTKNIRCRNGNDGFVTVSVSGGTPQYTYSWSHNANLNNPSATNLPAATYVVTVTDANNCTRTQSNILTQPAAGMSFNPFTVTNVTCFGGNNGSVTANPTGGLPPYTYQWNVPGSGNQITNLTAGTYRVTVTDDSLCQAIDSALVTSPPQIVVTGTVTDVSCFGQSDGQIAVNVTPVGTYTFNWTNGASGSNPTGLAANTYALTVTNSSNCTGSNSFVVNQPTLFALNPPNITNVSCFGGNNGSVTANPTGGNPPYTYSWTGSGSGGQTNTGLTANNYSVTVTDSRSCTVEGNYSVTQPTQLVFAQPEQITNVLCNGASTGAISVFVSGGTPIYTYSWSGGNPPQPNITGLPANNYFLTVSDANGCTLTNAYAITQPSAVQVSMQVIRNVSCGGGNDGSASASASGGVGNYTFTWSNGNTGNVASNLNAVTTYTVTATDGNGCTATATVTVTEPVAVTANPIVTDVTCFLYTDGSIDANPAGGTAPYTFLWSNTSTSQIADNLLANDYQCTVTDANGCTHVFSRVVSQPGLLQVSATSIPESCSSSGDGKIVPVGIGGVQPYQFTYSFDGVNFLPGASDTIRNLSPASYQVVITDGNNCTAGTLVNVGTPPRDVYDLIVDTTSCFGSAYTDGRIRIIPLTIVNQPHIFKIDDANEFSLTGDFENLSAGAHKIYIRNNFGCDTTFFVDVPQPLPGTVDIFPDDSTIQMGQSIQLFSLLKPYSADKIISYNWSPASGLSCVDCANPVATPFANTTTYSLTVVYTNDCKASSSVVLSVEGEPELFIPNLFSPNGDGVNDRFEVFGAGIRDFNLKIFNRWGEKVFESTNQFETWDGSYKGVMQMPDVFTYLLTVIYLNDRTVTKSGTVTMSR